MSASWKQYGGAKSLETNRKITTNTVVTDEIVLKSSFIGAFTITGVLDVSGKAYLRGGLDVSGTINTTNIDTNIISVSDNAYLYGSVLAGGDISANKNIIIGNSVSVGNNLTVKNNAYIANNIFLNQDDSGNFNQFIFGDSSGIGINTIDPTYALDINTNNINGIRVNSNNITNHNIIASNIDNKGITVTSAKYDDNNGGPNSSINFWVTNPVFTKPEGDAYIKAVNSGLLEINTKKDTVILSTLCISHRPDETRNHIFNETAIIYDLSGGSYKTEIYDNEDAHTGNALTLVADDKTSTTFLNILTPSGDGIGVAGGTYPTDTTRSVGILGVYESSNNYLQSQIIVSGTDPVKYKTTMGINTYQPTTEKYILDINGPVHIANGDITVVNISDFQIIKMVSSPAKNLVMAIGMPTNKLEPLYGYSRILISQDYGATWREGLFQNDVAAHNSPFSPINGIYTLNDIAIYDNTYAVIIYSDSANKPNLLYSRDGGIYWNTTSIDSTFSSTQTYNFNKVIIKDAPTLDNSGNTTIQLYITTKTPTTNNGLYQIILIFNNSGAYISNIINDTFINGDIRGFDYYYPTNRFIFATSTGIYSLNNRIYNLLHNSNSVYNEIQCKNNNIIAVGNNIISVSTDGINFTNISFNNITFTSIHIFNNFAFTIGNLNTIWISETYGTTWYSLWDSLDSISQSGKQWLIMNPINNYSNIIMTDANTILLANTIIPYSSISNSSQSSIINCFFPNLCNRSNNHILDISGNMRISGDIQVNDNGKIISNNSLFSLINENVNTVNFAGNATSITIGNTRGNTIIRNNLTVQTNETILGNLSIQGQETIYNITESTGLNTGALIINGGASISKNLNLGGNLLVGKNTNISGSLDIISDTSINGILYVNSGLHSSGHNNGAVVIKGGVGISGNININQNAIINGNITMSNSNSTALFNSLNVTGISNINGSLAVYGQETIYNITESTGLNTGALIINGGASISKNLNLGGNLLVGKNTIISGSLGVISDTSINGILYVNSGLHSSGHNNGAVVIKGGVGISGNININQNAIINGNITMSNSNSTALLNSLNVTGISTLNGNVNIGSGFNSTNTNTGVLVINGGVGIDKDIYIGGSLYGTNLSASNISSSGILTANQITSNTINSVQNSTMNIGTTSSSLNIGNPSNNSNIEFTPNNIQINAGTDGIVKIDCSSLIVTGSSIGASQILQYSNTLIMNIDQSGSQYINLNGYASSSRTASSAGSGIWIRDFSNDTAGQFVISADLQGYIFKPTTYTTDIALNEEKNASVINTQVSPIWNNPYLPSQNILRLDVNNMQIRSPNQNNNIVAICPSSDNESRYTITSFAIDISNIMLKDRDISSNSQKISTDLLLHGNVYHNNNTYFNSFLYSNKNAIFNNLNINKQTAIPNTVFDVSGNSIINRLGIGTSAVNINSSLDVNGSISHSNGYIYQF